MRTRCKIDRWKKNTGKNKRDTCRKQRLVKVCLFANVILHIRDPEDSTRQFLELMSIF